MFSLLRKFNRICYTRVLSIFDLFLIIAICSFAAEYSPWLYLLLVPAMMISTKFEQKFKQSDLGD